MTEDKIKEKELMVGFVHEEFRVEMMRRIKWTRGTRKRR